MNGSFQKRRTFRFADYIFDLSEDVGVLYDEASQMELKDMNAFFPELDILASLHEKGNMRMFMN